jgi:Flp pilus assembly pilin Flp
VPVSFRNALQNHLFRLVIDVCGQGIVEYALMLALVAFGAVAAEQTFACEVGCGFEYLTNQLAHILGTGKKIPPGQAKKCSRKCV